MKEIEKENRKNGKERKNARLNAGHVLTVLLGKQCQLCKTKLFQARLS